MKIIACVRQTPDTETVVKIAGDGKSIETDGIKYIIGPYDEYSLEAAVQLKDETRGNVTALSLGPSRVGEALRASLARGADSAVHINTDGAETDDALVVASALAEQIKAAQGPEITQLESWLEQWGEPTEMPETGNNDMPGMDMDEGMDGMEGMEGMQMEGMMSEEDMQALSDAQGTDAARLFLEQMIAHHEGAVDMAQTEIEDGQFPDAVEMARTIVDTQQQEIDTMRQLLTTL